MSLPRVAVVSAGSMGAAVGHRLVKAGLTVFTNLDGRSKATRHRAAEAGLQDVPFNELAQRADWVLSILPPKDAYSFAEQFVQSSASLPDAGRIAFADLNAVSPKTVKQIATLFEKTPIKFIDGGIIGGPPTDTYNPTIYVSAKHEDESTLDQFVAFSNYGLHISPLKGEGAGIGDASALKMSYAGISKGSIGLYVTMILAAHAASPATANALLHELLASQPGTLQRISRHVPATLPKAYRWVAEMEEIAGFIGDGSPGGEIFHGLAHLYAQVEKSLDEDDATHKDVSVLTSFAKDAKGVLEGKSVERQP